MVQCVGNFCSVPLDLNHSGPSRKYANSCFAFRIVTGSCGLVRKDSLEKNSIFIPIEEDVSNSKGEEKYSGKEI